MAIFKLISPPVRHRYFSAAYKVKWFSWSDEFLRLIPDIERAAVLYGRPDPKKIEKYGAAHFTFDIDLDRIDKRLLLQFKAHMLSLAHFRVGKGLNFFSGLINSRISGESYHFITALLRSMIARHYRNQICALYAPVNNSPKAYDVPLSCHLNIPEFLWTVFEDVRPANYGATLFLPVQTLLQDILPRVDTLPPAKATRIAQLITSKSRKDRNGELNQLLYDRNHRWAKELREKLLLRAYAIKFARGQGFMVHDRTWMHGRNGVAGEASNTLLHRLTFGNGR